MKTYLVLFVSLTLIVHSQCGLIDGFLGKVKDTTSSITHNIGGALHYGKNFVFGSSEADATGRTVTKPGLIGTISLKIHDVSEAVREEVRTVFSMFDHTQGQGKGVIGRLLGKVKSRVFKVKSFLFGNSIVHNDKPNTPVKLGNDTRILSDKLRKYLFRNNTSDVIGVRQALISLHDAINRIRNNITKNKQDNGNGNEDGAGLIDIRISEDNFAGDLQDDFENGVDAAQDKIEEGVEEGRAEVKDSFKQNTDNFIQNQRSAQNNLDRTDYSANKLTSDVENSMSNVGIRLGDESDKVKDLMENSYKKVDFNNSELSKNKI